MASSKAALKSIKASLDAGDFAKASAQASELLNQDGKHYNALMFLGFAEEKLKHLNEAEKALRKALELKPEDVQPYKGLIRLYEQQGSDKVDLYHQTVLGLAKIYATLDDREQCQSVLNQYESFIKKHGSKAQYRQALELMLPSSPIYATLEGRVPHPSHTYLRILESSQVEEKQWIDKQISERRTRLGATLAHVTAEVKDEASRKFDVEKNYQNLIDWTQDDELRHSLEQELLQRMLDDLLAMPKHEKPQQRDKVLEKANGMVIIKQHFQLAWDIALEWVDSEDLADWDPTILHQYIEFFSDAGLAKVLRGLLYGNTSPHPLPTSSDPENPVTRLSEADQLIIMSEGLDDCKASMLAHRIMAHTYLALAEHERAAEMARISQDLYRKAEADYSLVMQDSLDAVSLLLGRSLVVYQSPRHHPEARTIFENILSRKPQSTDALIGIGLIYEEDEDYSEAVKFLARALERDPANLRIRLEYSWSRALDNDLEGGVTDLHKVLESLDEDQNPNLSMKAETLYRIAYCDWQLNTSVKARKDKTGPYRYLIESLKANPSYAPAYTLLGFYFQDYAKNKARARVAFQKAFELSTSELAAAEQLAQAFAMDAEWDLVELVAQRIVDSGKARPAPGSKKKAFSWPYAALGVVQMSRSQYSLSIVSFQHALRISPSSYHCWVGLGESYHNSGRYVAAARAFVRAESIGHGLTLEQAWFSQYMLANVQRELGTYEDAIKTYRGVLYVKPGEFGVLLSLLQTLVDFSWARFHQGHFGQAAELANEAIKTAATIAEARVDVFNMWKAAGDACSVLSAVKTYVPFSVVKTIKQLLEIHSHPKTFDVLNDTDQVGLQSLSEEVKDIFQLSKCLVRASILAHKRAVGVSLGDIHAQAVAYYNLGWAEHDAYVSDHTVEGSNAKRSRHFLKAAVRAFKLSIELEASNAEFWNALGVVTLTLNPKVSQHSLIRSLHLNDHSARVWTNLGVLYLHNSEPELANQAFTRAQSSDPEYAAAWIGQGLVATAYGKTLDAAGLFKHAFEIADASSIPAKRHYSVSTFDHLLRTGNGNRNLSTLVQPVFALRQLCTMAPADTVAKQLFSLFAERIGEHDAAALNLQQVCDICEARYEEHESNESLAKFAQAKSDVSRQLLAQKKYDEAIESAQLVLDLTEEEIPGYSFQRTKSRFSAHLTLGLAYSFSKRMAEAISSLEAAAEASKSLNQEGAMDPSITLLLSQVLWASTGVKEREAARTQLFECIEAYPSNVDAAIVLAVVSLLDGDEEGLDVATDDLKSLRASNKVDVVAKLKVSKVLSAVLQHQAAGGFGKETVRNDALSSIMLSPDQPQGWLELTRVVEKTDEVQFASEMAVQNAVRLTPPGGRLTAEELARAYTTTDRRQDVAQASMLAPWLEN